MLGELERKITAVIADGVAARPHLRVVAAPSTDAPPNPDEGVVRVALSRFNPEPAFRPGQFAPAGDGAAPRSRRVLLLQFVVHLGFSLRPRTDNAATSQASRGLLLDDMSIISHLLAAPEVQNGQALASTAPDPGYRVLSLQFERGSSAPAPADGLLTGSLAYLGQAEIWPPALSQAEGAIRALDLTLSPLPIAILLDRPVLHANGTTTARIRGVGGRRLADAAGTREPLRLAVTVLSDVPPDQRGTIISGEAGAETGARIVVSGAAETIVTYQAAALPPDRPRTEYIAVHLATPDRLRGLFLCSAAVQTLPGGP